MCNFFQLVSVVRCSSNPFNRTTRCKSSCKTNDLLFIAANSKTRTLTNEIHQIWLIFFLILSFLNLEQSSGIFLTFDIWCLQIDAMRWTYGQIRTYLVYETWIRLIFLLLSFVGQCDWFNNEKIWAEQCREKCWKLWTL